MSMVRPYNNSDDYDIYSEPVEVEVNLSSDTIGEEPAEINTLVSRRKNPWKFIVPLAIALVATYTVVDALGLLSGSKDMTLGQQQQQHTNAQDDEQTQKSVKKFSKSSKSGRGKETSGGKWESESMSLSFPYRDDNNAFMSMPSFDFSYPSIESNSADLSMSMLHANNFIRR